MTLTISNLRCESLINPLAIVVLYPRLSWIVESQARNQVQSAYEIIAASSPELLEPAKADLWSSGKVDSHETLNIEYRGQNLAPTQYCYWKVRVWNGDGIVSSWSETAYFAAGLTQADWTANWIGFDAARNLELPLAPFENAKWIGTDSSAVFLGELILPENAKIADARVMIASKGHFTLYWAGEYFAQSPRDQSLYMRRMTERLEAGLNRFIIRVEAPESVALIFRLVVLLEDGQEISFCSDTSWKISPNILNNWYEAEAHSWVEARVLANYGDAPWGFLYGDDNFLPPPSYLRGSLELKNPIKQATLFVTALGHYDFFINGQRINHSYFDPGWTDYHQRLYYRAFDVSRHLQSGKNVLGAILADGWFSGYIGWYHERDIYGLNPRLRAQLHLEFMDGTKEIVSTNQTWQASLGGIREADMLMGEVFDSRVEKTGWNTPFYNASDWQAVSTGTNLNPSLEPHPAPPVVALEAACFVPRVITEPKKGVYIFDLGQNFAGVVRLKIKNTSAGQRITIRHAERLNSDGTLYTRNLRTARAVDVYICSGQPEETWSPRFTFHGFQYVEVTGFTSAPDLETITGIPLSSDTPLAGSFECSDELVNKLVSNTYWSQRSNFLEIITDCPQRDERLGWGDGAWTFIGAAAMRSDVQTFYNKWTQDFIDAQLPDGQFPWLAPLVVLSANNIGPLWSGSSPAWSDAGIICPWMIYQRYGDLRQLERSYPAMVRQIEWYISTSRADLLPPEEFVSLGDWLNHNALIPHDVFRTMFFAYSTGLVAQSARVLGYPEDAQRFLNLYERIKMAFQTNYLLPDGRILGDVQGCYALAITFDLLKPPQAEKALEHLIKKIGADQFRPSTGLEATLPLMLALSKMNRSDIAYKLLHNREFPGWNFSILNGATTIWERWNSWTPENGFGDSSMNSFNHFSLGAVYQWMTETIGGIQMSKVAFKQIRIAPEPGGQITSARAVLDSPRGRIKTEWKIENNHFYLAVEIPANTTATLVLPSSNHQNVTENGLPLESACIHSQEAKQLTLSLGSGLYQFLVKQFE